METQLSWFTGHSGVYKYLLTSLTAFSSVHFQTTPPPPHPAVFMHDILFFCTSLFSNHRPFVLCYNLPLSFVNVALATSPISHSVRLQHDHFWGEDKAGQIKYTVQYWKKGRRKCKREKGEHNETFIISQQGKYFLQHLSSLLISWQPFFFISTIKQILLHQLSLLRGDLVSTQPIHDKREWFYKVFDVSVETVM